MGLNPMKQLGVSLLLGVLLLLTCALLLALGPHAPTHSLTQSMRPFSDPDGNVMITRNRALLGPLTRNAPIGYPPPPAMTIPSPPPY